MSFKFPVVFTDGVTRRNAPILVSDAQDPLYPSFMQPVNEAALIEERRKRREAIKAKHRGQVTPMLVQALTLNNEPAGLTSNPNPSGTISPAPGWFHSQLFVIHADGFLAVSPQKSPMLTAKGTLGQDSPNDFMIAKGRELTNTNLAPRGVVQEEEPSAADYDPTIDMQEDQMRHDKRNREGELPSSTYYEVNAVDQDVLPDTAVDQSTTKMDHDGFDMFAEVDELDMFAELPVAPKRDGSNMEAFKAVPVPQAKALDMSMLDDWDDQEGYYKVILGELLDGRYHVQSNLGRGMFSGVVRATDQRTTRLVAIKLIRNNETM